MRSIYIIAMLLGAAFLLGPECVHANDNVSWLADDVLDTYSKGTLWYLEDPTGAGLSVYDNYVIHTSGSTFMSKWKRGVNEFRPGHVPNSWIWNAGGRGDWVRTEGNTLIGYSLTSPPVYVYLGGRPIAYADYIGSSYFGQTNALWIVDQNRWTRNAAVPLGSTLTLNAYTTTPGLAEFYKILPDGGISQSSYPLNSGYTPIPFDDKAPGRYIISFIKDNQPSNSIIIDVL